MFSLTLKKLYATLKMFSLTLKKLYATYEKVFALAENVFV
jgi:hypothetical protein